jgi:hypothetical protein
MVGRDKPGHDELGGVLISIEEDRAKAVTSVTEVSAGVCPAAFLVSVRVAAA